MPIMARLLWHLTLYGLFLTPMAPQDFKGLDRTATSSVKTSLDKEGNIIITTVNRRFTFTDLFTEGVFSDEQHRTLLLLEEFKSERRMHMEQQKSSVRVEAWLGKDANPSDKIWTIEEAGDEGLRSDRFYKITKYGCCTQMDPREKS